MSGGDGENRTTSGFHSVVSSTPEADASREAAAVASDLNNFTGVIFSSLSYLRSQLGQLTREQRECLDDIETAAKRAAQLAPRLLQLRGTLAADRRRRTTRPDGARPASGPRQTTPSATILLVDDEPGLRRSYKRLLAHAGYHVVEAASGVEALQLCESAAVRPDLILLDLDMPLMTGDETLVRLLTADPAMRIIVVTGAHDAKREELTLARGALAVLRKPCDELRLLGEVAIALASPFDAAVEE